MKRIIIICLIFLSCSSVTSFSSELIIEENSDIVRLLNSVDLIKEINELPLRIRIYEYQEAGECDGAPSTCPGTVLFIAVSSYDEYPDQKLFRTKKAHAWKIKSLISLPKSEKDKDYAIFKVTKYEHGSYKEKHECYLRVNLNRAELYECR